MGNLPSIFKNCTCNVQVEEPELSKDNDIKIELYNLKKEMSIIKKKIVKLEQYNFNINNETNQKIDKLEMKIENKIDLINERFTIFDNKLDSKFDLILLNLNK